MMVVTTTTTTTVIIIIIIIVTVTSSSRGDVCMRASFVCVSVHVTNSYLFSCYNDYKVCTH